MDIKFRSNKTNKITVGEFEVVDIIRDDDNIVLIYTSHTIDYKKIIIPMDTFRNMNWNDVIEVKHSEGD